MTTLAHQTEYVCRMVFERVGDCSFIGHLDLMHVFERAVRRANLPILYSQGYNPKPMMVFALPLGVGIDTKGDYIDISFERTVPVASAIEEINKFLPRGIRLLSGVNIDEPKNSLMSVVTAAKYELTIDATLPEGDSLRAMLERLTSMDKILVDKKSKGKIIEVDIKDLILSLEQNKSSSKSTASIYVKAGSSSNLRPDVLLSALVKYCGLPSEVASNCKVTRLALYGGKYPRLEALDYLV